jgi:hypothetical protein
MGNIILLQDTYPFQLPSEPNDEKKILYHDRKKADQFWERPALPNFRSMSKQEKTRYIDEERRRLTEGLHMFINGELVWITPVHYDFLMYSNLPEFSEPPRYYNSQRLDFYFQEFVELDINCFGEIVIKPRRYGYTAMVITRIIHKAMSDFGINIGLASMDLYKAKTTLFRPMIDSFFTRPKYTRPEVYAPGGKAPQTELRFRKNIITRSDEEDEDEIQIGEDSGLRSWISPRPTTAKTFDGHKWHFVVKDEIFKWTEARPYNTWQITKETLQVGGRIIGKAALFASMGDDETCDNAVEDGIKLWSESNYNDRNKYGRTTSGLYRWFIPAYAAFEMFMDKYGNCNEALAKEYLLEERSKFEEGSLEYLYHVRKYPFTPEEAMSSAENSSVFSAARLQAQRNRINSYGAKKPYTIGNFEIDTQTDKVIFEPMQKGMWKMAYNIHKDARNRCPNVNGKILLPRNIEGVIGNDPTRTAENVSGHLSMNAAYVYQKFDYFGTGNAGKLLAQLYGRHEDTKVFNEQLRRASLYYGYPLMTERQVTSTYDHFVDAGMKHFLLKSEYDKATGLWMKGNVIDDGLDLIQDLIKKPESGMEDLLEYINFEELIHSLRYFDKTKSTKFDPVMALICTVIGAKQIKYTVVSQAQIEMKKKLMTAFFPVRS